MRFMMSGRVATAWCALAMSGPPAGAGQDLLEVRRGPAESPLKWVVVAPADTATARTLRLLAGTFLGMDSVSVASVDLVTVDDRGWLGDGVRRVWRVRTGHAAVRRALVEEAQPSSGGAASIELVLAFDELTRELLFASTEPRPVWVLPAPGVGPAEGIRGRAEGFCERSEPLGARRPRMTIPRVLGEVWGRCGLDPQVAGLFVLRPRSMLCKWPPQEVDGGPNRDPAIYWICEAYGVERPVVPSRPAGVAGPDSRPAYASGAVWMINDEDPRIGFGFDVL